ncbi:MAG: dihydrodipicolinate synthase family protein [Fimbriimonadaceae bacterium]
MEWIGVLPAVTTQFDASGELDQDAVRSHAQWMVESGCKAIVALGSLGEGATLSFEEKQACLAANIEGAGGAPVVASVSALSTNEAVRVAKMAEAVGCSGLMVLPPYAHRGPWRELAGHFGQVFEATSLPCMLYNNPIAYGLDVLPDQMVELAERHSAMVAVKESSADVRRVTEIKRLAGDRLRISVGVDDLFVEGVAAGAVGWVAGLVNAFPVESVRLYELATAGDAATASQLYEWFLPLLRLDVIPEFVQAIKLVQQEVGRGHERVRAPRMTLQGPLREHALEALRIARSAYPAI